MKDDKHTINSISLYEWVRIHRTDKELQNLFLNMDRTLKYIHDHNYCVDGFNVSNIFILDNRDDCIQFKYLEELPSDMDMKKERIKKDIFDSTFIQISIYSNTIWNIKNINDWGSYISFLKDNFDAFSEIIPNEDVPYYRGIVQREASVYYCEYVSERKKRELEELEKQYSDPKEKSIVSNYQEEDITNRKVNDLIYRQISGIKDAAFINLMVIPLVMFSILVIYLITTIIMNMF